MHVDWCRPQALANAAGSVRCAAVLKLWQRKSIPVVAPARMVPVGIGRLHPLIAWERGTAGTPRARIRGLGAGSARGQGVRRRPPRPRRLGNGTIVSTLPHPAPPRRPSRNLPTASVREGGRATRPMSACSEAFPAPAACQIRPLPSIYPALGRCVPPAGARGGPLPRLGRCKNCPAPPAARPIPAAAGRTARADHRSGRAVPRRGKAVARRVRADRRGLHAGSGAGLPDSPAAAAPPPPAPHGGQRVAH